MSKSITGENCLALNLQELLKSGPFSKDLHQGRGSFQNGQQWLQMPLHNSLNYLYYLFSTCFALTTVTEDNQPGSYRGLEFSWFLRLNFSLSDASLFPAGGAKGLWKLL